MAHRDEYQANKSSSGTAMGDRNRTSGTRLSPPLEGAAFAFLALILVQSIHSQVTVIPDPGPIVGPGRFDPKVAVCNQTNLPRKVEGYRFHTQTYAGYTTWMAGLTNTGTNPVQYTQAMPTSEQEMLSGQCRQPTDYTAAALTAGQIATLFDGQALIKTGSCAEAPIYTDASPHGCSEVDAIQATVKYSTSACLVDTIGANGGDTYGGFVSTFAGQTQIQAVIPPNTFTVSNTTVRWNPYAYGPQYMMGLAGAQEIINVDMQFLAAVAAKETFMGLVLDATGNRLLDLPPQVGVHGAWQVESPTFATWIKAYPQFFPKYGPCISRNRDVTTAFPACAPSMHEPAEFYLRPTPTTQMGPNSPQLINGAVVSALGFYVLYDAMRYSTDLCFIDIIQKAVDPRVALAVLLPGYNLGRNSGFEAPLKTHAATIRTNPNASTLFPEGNNGYRPNVFNVLDQFVNASKNCAASRRVYDTTISLAEVQRFIFGGSTTPGTPAVQGDGGLLLHYDLTVPQRQSLWDSVTCAFDKLKGKAPSMATPARAAFISYRYDFLTLLRVVKSHLPIHIQKRARPVEHDFDVLVARNSVGTTVCGTNKPQDRTYPTLTLTSPRPGDQVDQNKNPGTSFTFKATDVGGLVAKAEWSLDKNWNVWNPARKAGTDSYEFNVPCETPGWPKAGQAGKLWVSTTDDCGNTTVQELPFTVKTGTFCGDAPPLDPPVATPGDSPFFDSIMVALATPGVTGTTIHYTVDGSQPTPSSPVYTGPIKISGATTVVLRAFATKPNTTRSAEASWTYTKETRQLTQTPVANPPGRTFTDEDPPFPVTLISELGAVIHYTTDGTPATLNSPVYTVPIQVSSSMTINAIAVLAPTKAPSQPMLPAVFIETKSPILAQKGALYDDDGDGRMERAVITFAKALPANPPRLNLIVVGPDGQTHTRNPTGAEITRDAANGAVVTVLLANPFPFGVTSLGVGSKGQTMADLAIPLLDGDFPLEDQAAPVIIKAVVVEGDSAQPMKRVEITYSEPMKGPPTSQTAWTFKRGADEMPTAEVRLSTIIVVNDRLVQVFIDTASVKFPIRGDSVAIALTGEITDVASSLAPKAKLFRLLEGDAAAAKPVKLTILFPDGSKDKPSQGNIISPASDLFIPLGADGTALPGSREQGRCPGCVAREGDRYVGPVLQIATPGALSYSFRIFTNLGEFVAETKGHLDDKDLQGVKKDRAGVNFEIPVVWTGNTQKGLKAGTGAYVLLAQFTLKKDLRTGADQAKFAEKRKFGLIRNR